MLRGFVKNFRYNALVQIRKLGVNVSGKILVWVIEALGSVLAIVPHRVFLACIDALAWLMRVLDKKRRYTDALHNLNFIYGDSLSQAQKQHIIKRCYRNFAFVILESIRVAKIPYATHSRRFDVVDEKYLLDCLDNQGSAVLISAHFGYWEAMATFLPPRYRQCQMASLGRLTGIESVDSLIISRRELQGVTFINKSGAFRHLLKLYGQKNALVGILVDQSISASEGEIVEFMDKKATHTTIASVLSRRFDVGIVPVFINMNEDYSRFKVQFYPPIFAPHSSDSKADIKYATQLQADITSKVVKENPSSWFWFHKRWKDFYREIYT